LTNFFFSFFFSILFLFFSFFFSIFFSIFFLIFFSNGDYTTCTTDVGATAVKGTLAILRSSVASHLSLTGSEILPPGTAAMGSH